MRTKAYGVRSPGANNYKKPPHPVMRGLLGVAGGLKKSA